MQVYYELRHHGRTRTGIEREIADALEPVIEHHVDGPTAHGSGVALVSGQVEVRTADEHDAVVRVVGALPGPVERTAVLPEIPDVLAS